MGLEKNLALLKQLFLDGVNSTQKECRPHKRRQTIVINHKQHNNLSL